MFCFGSVADNDTCSKPQASAATPAPHPAALGNVQGKQGSAQLKGDTWWERTKPWWESTLSATQQEKDSFGSSDTKPINCFLCRERQTGVTGRSLCARHRAPSHSRGNYWSVGQLASIGLVFFLPNLLFKSSFSIFSHLNTQVWTKEVFCLEGQKKAVVEVGQDRTSCTRLAEN